MYKLVGASYELHLYGSPYGLLDLQWARTPGAALQVLESWAAPADAQLLVGAHSYVVWDFVLLLGAGLLLTGLPMLLWPLLTAARAVPNGGGWSACLAVLLHKLVSLTVAAPPVAVVLGAVTTVLHRQVLSTAASAGPKQAVGAMTVVASILTQGKFLMLVFAVCTVTASGLFLLTCNRSRWVKEFLEVVRVTRFSLLTVVAIGLALCVPDQLRDAFRTLAESSGWQIFCTEVVLLVWALTVWYAGRFLLNVDFQTGVFHPAFQFSPMSPMLSGERQWPRLLGATAFFVFALATFLAWWEVAASMEATYPWLWALTAVNVVSGVAFWELTAFRRQLFVKLTGRQLASPRGLTFHTMPRSVQWLVRGAVIIVLALWLAVFCFLQEIAPFLGTVMLLLGAAITVTIAGSLLVWLGERAKLPAISMVVGLALVFSFTNDNHTVRRLPGTRSIERIVIEDHLRDWHAWIQSKYPGQQHPLFLVSAAGGGIRAAYWTASVLAHLQDLNPAFADHTFLVSSVSGGSLGSLVFANLVDTVKSSDKPSECVKGQYRALAASILSHDFLAPTAASMLYGDFLARLLPFSFLSDRAEALEVAWERAWDAVKHRPPANVRGPLWSTNPFERSFDALLANERIDMTRPARSQHLPLVVLNGTIVESGTRILVSHLKHPESPEHPEPEKRWPFRGDLENAFDHRQAPIRMSTAALMSARFTYISPAGTYAPGTHVVDGGYFENSGAVTALQWWAEIRPIVDALNETNQQHRIRPVFLYIDNSPPPSAREWATTKRQVLPHRAESLVRGLSLLPELSPPVNALLHAREAHAVEARHRAERLFRDDFIAIDTNLVIDETRKVRLDRAPLGWVLSKTTQKLLDNELCENSDSIKKVLDRLATSEKSGEQ
jgi:hypothetical protein